MAQYNVKGLQTDDLRLQMLKEAAFLGYAVVQVIGGLVTVTFGYFNGRTAEKAKVNKIKGSYHENEVQWHKYPIPFLIENTYLPQGRPLSLTALDAMRLPPIEFTEVAITAGKIHALGGLHRVTALAERLALDFQPTVDRLQIQYNNAVAENRKSTIIDAYKEQLEEAIGLLKSNSLWMGEFYCHGA